MFDGLVCIGLASLMAAAEPPPPPAPLRPPAEGLRLWLDAADPNSLSVGPAGVVRKWVNRSDSKRAVRPAGAAYAVLTPDTVNDLPAVRFDDSGGLIAPALGPGRHDVVVFVVFRQSRQQAARRKGQSLIVALGPNGMARRGETGFSMAADDRPLADANAPALYQLYRRGSRPARSPSAAETRTRPPAAWATSAEC